MKNHRYEIEDYEEETKEQDFSVQKIRNLVSVVFNLKDFQVI